MNLTDPTSAPRDPAADLDRRVARKQRRLARSAQELTELYNERADLRGLNPRAELFAESVRWCA